jgi:hypothetical protein
LQTQAIQAWRFEYAHRNLIYIERSLGLIHILVAKVVEL